MYQKHQDARKEKSELEVQVKHLTGQIGTLKEKFTGSEKELVVSTGTLLGLIRRRTSKESSNARENVKEFLKTSAVD